MAFLKSSDEILSITEFSQRFKNLVKQAVPELWLRGEVSGVKVYSSGHTYFTLKDEGATISAVLFKGYARGMSVQLKEGMKILAYGEVSVYEARGSYQIVLKAIMPDGLGDLSQRFEELKRKLASEGLFDSDKKKSIPKLPKKVGVITSPTGAAIRDFLSILSRRDWKGEVLILPSRVQGEEAASEIVSQIKTAQTLDLDLLVITRGGGSLEDLWCFNEEIVARAVAACKIPTISAVGHEIDFSLCDFASDLRAETPSAAAEYISSRFLEIRDSVDLLKDGIDGYVESYFSTLSEKLTSLEHLFIAASPKDRIQNLKISLDENEARLNSQIIKNIADKRHNLNSVYAHFTALNPTSKIDVLKEKLSSCEEQLELLSVDSVLKRGFAYLENEDGKILQKAKAVPFDTALKLHFHDGSIDIKRYSK